MLTSTRRARRRVIKIDLGDIALSITATVKGLQRPRLVWHVGPPRDTMPADRSVNPHNQQPAPAHREVGLIVDLMADQQVPLSVQFTDEIGNPVLAPEGAVITFTVDDATIINLTDNGDGTANAAATGALGTANVHVDAAWNGNTVSGDLQLVVVAGLAERVTVVAGTPTEVTPDV